jgi:hypothetical protein
MKLLISLALIVLAGGLCAAQTTRGGEAAAPPGVTVVESSWRRFWARNPALYQDPLRPLEDQQRSERIRQEVARQNAIRAEMGKDQIPLPARNATGPLPPRSPANPFVYSYRAKITNTGAKKIRGLVWEYVFVDPSTGSEVSRRRFESNVSVGPGQSKTLYGRSDLPPVLSVDAGKASQGPEGQHSERVVITKIFYDDKTTWERASE